MKKRLAREYSLREIFNGSHWIVRSGASWPMMPHGLPPWEALYQQTQRWLHAGVFKAFVDELRVFLRLVED